MSNLSVNQLTPGQKEDIQSAMEIFFNQLIIIAPPTAPNLLSGGILQIQTMSGMNLKLGFGPRAGGLILPGGIQPHSSNGGLIK